MKFFYFLPLLKMFFGSPRSELSSSEFLLFTFRTLAKPSSAIWCQRYKTYYVYNLRNLIISQSVCPRQAFPAIQTSLIFGGKAGALMKEHLSDAQL